MRASLYGFSALALSLAVAGCDPGTVTPRTDGGGRDAGGGGSCTAGQTFCNGRCIPTDTNPIHCGGCGIV